MTFITTNYRPKHFSMEGFSYEDFKEPQAYKTQKEHKIKLDTQKNTADII